MTTVAERAVLACVKRTDAGASCPGLPIVRYAIGPVCSGHLLTGAEVYEWLTQSDGQLELAAAMAGPGTREQADRIFGPVDGLPNPGRAKAAQHADAAPGEANAARLVAYRAGNIRARVLEHLVQAGPRGTTAIEAWRWYQATHSSSIERYSVAPRLSELVGDGWAVKTGGTRNVRGPDYPPEEVYVLSARGRRERTHLVTTVPVPQSVQPVLMPWPGQHYGCRVVELGEDSDMWAVAGPERTEHVSDRRAVAAVLHHLRTECSFTRADLHDLVGQFRKVERRWVSVTDDEDEPWQWTDLDVAGPAVGAWAVTYLETY